MDEELDDFIEWLRVLQLPEEDFRRHIRGYFDNTSEMNQYIEERKPQAVRYAHLQDPETIALTAIPTKPYAVQEAVTPEPKNHGHYKGKRRKR